jgi:hypothetical protein
MLEGLIATEIILLAAMLAAAIFTLTVIRPELGAYLCLVVTPLIVGIARGDTLGFLRPNEALLALLVAALVTRTLLLMLAGHYEGPAVDRIDLALVLLAAASSILPLALRYGRDLPVTTDDLLYATVLWKYFLLYRVFRAAVTTPAQVRRCLWLSMVSAMVVALVAILQVSNLLGVPEFLHTYYERSFEGYTGPVTERATSMIGSSFGLADVMIMNLLLALAFARLSPRRHWLLIAPAGLFLAGAIAAGEFSGFIGLLIALLAFGLIIRSLGWLLAVGLPALLLALFVFWSVIAERLAGFETGIPKSWQGRWENLQDFFFPELFSALNWLVGVRPAARLPAPEKWRDWIYIESGYVWLLWIGGIPFLAAFAFFIWVAAERLWLVTRARQDALAVAASASMAYVASLVVLMLFDPHLTLRGAADLFFPLLALSCAVGEDARSVPLAVAYRRRPA